MIESGAIGRDPAARTPARSSQARPERGPVTPAKAMLPVVVAFAGLALLGVAAYLYTTRGPAAG